MRTEDRASREREMRPCGTGVGASKSRPTLLCISHLISPLRITGHPPRRRKSSQELGPGGTTSVRQFHSLYLSLAVQVVAHLLCWPMHCICYGAAQHSTAQHSARTMQRLVCAQPMHRQLMSVAQSRLGAEHSTMGWDEK